MNKTLVKKDSKNFGLNTKTFFSNKAVSTSMNLKIYFSKDKVTFFMFFSFSLTVFYYKEPQVQLET